LPFPRQLALTDRQLLWKKRREGKITQGDIKMYESTHFYYNFPRLFLDFPTGVCLDAPTLFVVY